VCNIIYDVSTRECNVRADFEGPIYSVILSGPLTL